MRFAPAEKALVDSSWLGEVSHDALARDAIVRELMRPLAGYLLDPDTTEVVVNAPGKVMIERGASWIGFDAPELTAEHLLSLATAVASYCEQAIGPSMPILSAMLPGNERIQIVVPPAVEAGRVSLTIRKPGAKVKALEEYEQEGAFDRYVWASREADEAKLAALSKADRSLMALLRERRLGDFLRQAVLARKNIGVIGDTGSGKTTLMKALCQIIRGDERVITIEDVRELFLPRHENAVHLLYSKGGQGVAKVTPADLIASCMRMKPDRALLAELRGAEAFDFLKLLTAGHSGSITSWHAESCALAPVRYVFMCKEHEQAAIYSTQALQRLVDLTIDVFIHVVSRIAYASDGTPLLKQRYVAEVHFDPIAKMQASYGESTVHRTE